MDVAVRIYVDCSGHDDLNRMPTQVMGALMRWGCADGTDGADGEIQRVTLNNKALYGASFTL
ncbi:hypothetical protein [Aeromonas hydrophila]|uniref:hypothetical protein n=1 Tax=Aeromonas hydrophila TaxID=644 RepID=UPI001269A970|nr:hypothetical protein [Aeromonas hydrophila]